MKLPKGWKKKSLEEACSLKSGRFIAASSISAEYNQGLYPCYGGNGIRGYVTETSHSGEYPIIGRQGALCGNVKYACGDFYATEHAIVAHTYTEVTPKWLYYILDYSNLNRLATGQAQPGLAVSSIEKYIIMVPPLPEQRAIADILSTWDRAIDTTEKLIAAKEERLEGFAREIFQSTKNKNQRGWKPVVLSSILSEHRHISTGVEKVFSVSVHKGMVNQIEHLGRSFSSNDTSKYNRVHFGDIVYTKSPTGNFPLGIVKQSHIEEDIIVSPLYGVFTPENFDLGTILDFYFNSPTRSKNYLSPIIQKGAKNTIAITNSTFLSNQITLPTEPFLQREIAGFIRTSREEISLQKDILINYKQQKRGLMQKLLTGEWRIKGV